MCVFYGKIRKTVLNYPCYHFLSGATSVQGELVHVYISVFVHSLYKPTQLNASCLLPWTKTPIQNGVNYYRKETASKKKYRMYHFPLRTVEVSDTHTR